MAAPKSYSENRQTGYRSKAHILDTKSCSMNPSWKGKGMANVRGSRLPGDGNPKGHKKAY